MITVRPLPALERSRVRAVISGYTSAERFSFTSDGSWDHLLFQGVLVPCDPPFTSMYLLPGAEDLAHTGALAAAGHAFGP